MSDVTKTCRICVLEQSNLVNVKQTFESCGRKSTLKDIFNECSPVQIEENDVYPKRFCISCLSELLRTYEFRQKCLKSLKLLENKFPIESSEDEESSEPTTLVVKKRKHSESIPGPSCSKIQKFTKKEVDFENIIAKNEIILQTGEEDDDEEEEKEIAINEKVMQETDDKNASECKPKALATPNKNLDHQDLGEFKITVMRGYKNSMHVVFEANGFLYVNTRSTPNRRYLRCSTSKNCPGKAYIDVKPHDVMEEYLYVYRLHNHPKDILHITKLQFLEEIRTIAANGNYSPKQVYETAITKFPELRTVMPYTSLTSRLYRLSSGYNMEQNQQVDTLIKFAGHLTKVRPRKYCQTSSGVPFFQEAIIDQEHGTCSLIYANTQLIDNVSWSNELFVDSSFKVNFENGRDYHFLTICIVINEHRFPIFFALLDTSTQAEYTKVLTLFKDKYAPSLHPEEIITDFNADLFKALSDVYKHSTISGSLIHFIFYIYKQCNVDEIVKQIELRTECMKMQSCLFALPILPPQLIPSALEHLKAEARTSGIEEIFSTIFDYVENVWINGVTPQVFSSFRSMSCVNENIFNAYKKLRDVISSNKKFGFFDINEKLLTIEDWVSTTYQKVLDGEKLPRHYVSSKYGKVLNRLWQPNHIQKSGFYYFFEAVGPLIEKMTGLIWIWGFYNYSGNNDEPLIHPEDYFGTEVPRQIIVTEEEQVEEDVETEEGTQVITLQIIKPGVIIQK